MGGSVRPPVQMRSICPLPSIWQHIPPTKVLISEALKQTKTTRVTQKSLPFGKWRFSEKGVGRMGQKQKSIRQKDNRTRQKIYLFIYWRLKAQSTAQGHLKASLLLYIYSKLNLTEVENNTKHAYFTNIKHINIIRKLVPSVLLS